jgi:hypothetical protein
MFDVQRLRFDIELEIGLGLGVSTVEEIKKAAGALSVNEREELLSWLLDVNDDWDRQMSKDAAAGKLDSLVEEARTAVREESLRDWPKPKT